ncbi:MAG: hypothetical protein U5O39_09770 [Gammaproteobacteria bacterium]|nr:hypothetical protein [Gammaproteobacteria bacterium]
MEKWFIFAFLAAGVMAQAQGSSVVDSRGYRTCESRLTEELWREGPTFQRVYYLERGDNARTFYINAHVWANKQRTAIRAMCTTSINGRDIQRVEIHRGGAYTMHDGGLAIR